MECKQFKEFAKDMVDYIGDYLENIRDRYVRLYVCFLWTFLCPLRYCAFSFVVKGPAADATDAPQP
jgi:hypothetical protein